MTAEELFPEYEKLFKLVIETAGQENGNEIYKNVYNIIDENREIINRSIEDDIPFNVFVSLLAFLVIKEVHGIEKLSEMDDENLKGLIDSMFKLYLEKPTRKFTSKYGLPVVYSLNTYLKIILMNSKNEKF